MSPDTKRWRACRWLRELVSQWHTARGFAEDAEFQRPFSRNWQDLLEAAGMTSAEARSEAFRDAQSLQAAGLLSLKTSRYRPYQIERLLVPFASEARLRELFEDELPGRPDPGFDFTSVSWAPQLRFLSDSSRTTVAPDDLLKLNNFLASRRASKPIVPIKERSLEVFGNEKRLDALLTTSLFRNGHLDLKNDLRCELVGEPLGWKRGPTEAADRPLIVIENAATWHSYCRWNAEQKLFSAVVYGCGDRFVDGVAYIADIFAELGGVRPILYFGDLDPRGVSIPQEASTRHLAADLPAISPHLWSYRQLLTSGIGCEQPWEGEQPPSSICDWLQDLAEPACQLFAANHRLAQEHVGWEFLNGRAMMD
jgi:hypothetical protein